MDRVLITGITGFIGYELAVKLSDLGYDVYGIVRFISSRRLLPPATIVSGDLTDYHSIVRAVRQVKPNVVIHLGALTPVSESYEQPITYAETNYIGTIHLLEALRKYSFENLRLVAIAGTTEMYNSEEPIDEETPYSPTSPYSVSKIASVMYAEYMYRAYSLPIVIVIPTNTYGRFRTGQEHFIVEKLITSMLRGDEVIKLGDPNIVRDFMFRIDHVDAYVTLVKNVIDMGRGDIIGQKFVFGTGRGVTIGELFNIVSKLTGWSGRVYWYVYSRPFEARKIVTKPEKAKRVLGWEARFDIVSGVKIAIEEWRGVIEE